MTHETHFGQRCRERGITGIDTDLLFRGIIFGIEHNREDLVEHVKDDPERGSRYWRVKVPNNGIFYVVTGMDDARPRTVYTQRMMRSKKWAMKSVKRNKGRRHLRDG